MNWLLIFLVPIICILLGWLVYNRKKIFSFLKRNKKKVLAGAAITLITLGGITLLPVGDPPEEDEFGWELLDGATIFHMWNKYDNYYFNRSNGIQFSNHYLEYWTTNILMLGYYDGNDWNLIYRTDKLSGFTESLNFVENVSINVTLWKDLSYGAYDFRLAIRYTLGVNDFDLIVIPYIKNLGIAIPFNIGFGWKMKDIQINANVENDYIDVNNTQYFLNQTLDNKYTNLSFPIIIAGSNYGWTQPRFELIENQSCGGQKYLYLVWNKNLNYVLWVKNMSGQYNAPITLFVKVGTLGVNQEKYTEMRWYDSEATYYFNAFNEHGEEWTYDPANMVNGNTGNYAAEDTDNKVELCTGNTCSGGSGTISKVEMRAYGMRAGPPGTDYVQMRPVFTGGDGQNWAFSLPDDGDWSAWEEITSYNNAPGTWTWGDIQNLDMDMEADVNPGIMANIAKIEIKITYTISNAASEITNPGPANASTNVVVIPTMNITLNDPEGDTMNLTWYSNSSGSWVAFGTNSSVNNGTYHQVNSNFSDYSTKYWWNVSVHDGHSGNNSDVFEFTTHEGDGPVIVINFAGNLGADGGPYFKCGLESAGQQTLEGDYANQSRHADGWMYINCSITDASAIDVVWLNWLNDTTWVNWTYQFIVAGDFYEVNTSSNFSTGPGYDYSFDIYVNDTYGNSNFESWNKTGMWNGVSIPIVRRTIQLNCTAVNIDNIPYYLYDAGGQTGGSGDPKDRLNHDQGPDDYDTGYLWSAMGGETIQYVWCGGAISYWFDQSICLTPMSITNIYYHTWGNTTTGEFKEIGWGRTRTTWDAADESYGAEQTDGKSNVTYDSDVYYLNVKLFYNIDEAFTTNDIYEFFITYNTITCDATTPKVIHNSSITSFVMFNIPSNATLSGWDNDSDGLDNYAELWHTFTNPYDSDTDNDGVSDFWENESGTDPNDFTDTPVTISAGIRNDGEDYFTWLGINGTASTVALVIADFDEAGDKIFLWNETSWDTDEGCWFNYTGAAGGTDFVVTTFDIIKIILTDSGTQEITMCKNSGINYDVPRSIPLINESQNLGYNYTGYTSNAGNTLGGINGTNLTLATGHWIAVWDNSSYEWVPFFSGYAMNSAEAVTRWVVCQTKVSTARTWTI